MHLSLISGQVAAFTWLTDHGADTEASDRRGQHALHHAILADSEEMLTFLLTKDIDKSAVERSGLTPLQFALAKKKFKALEELVRCV